MEGFIDIHSHILPQLDDGSKSIEQTINMVKIAASEGIKTIIVTPHYHEGRIMVPYSDVLEGLKQINENQIIHNFGIEFRSGSEIYYTHDSIKHIHQKRIPTMAESRYVLIEFSPAAESIYIKKALQEFIFEGYLPIIAHIERYLNVSNDLENVDNLIELGAYVQVNAMSVTGEMGRACKKAAKELLKNNLVHFIATDSHSDGKRAPRLSSCAKYISKKYGDAYAMELMIDNPCKIINNEYI